MINVVYDKILIFFAKRNATGQIHLPKAQKKIDRGPHSPDTVGGRLWLSGNIHAARQGWPGHQTVVPPLDVGKIG